MHFGIQLSYVSRCIEMLYTAQNYVNFDKDEPRYHDSHIEPWPSLTSFQFPIRVRNIRVNVISFVLIP